MDTIRYTPDIEYTLVVHSYATAAAAKLHTVCSTHGHLKSLCCGSVHFVHT